MSLPHDPPQAPSEVRVRLPELSALMSLRFFAAVGVFLLHVSNVTGLTLYPGEQIADWPRWLQALHEGYYRQTFFLMLSGFILVYVYHSRVEQTEPRAFAPGFLIRRIARIWPLHALMVLVMLPGVVDDLSTHAPNIALAFVAQMTLLHGFFPMVEATSVTTIPVSFNGPAWALSCEFFAYLCFPMLGWLLVPRFAERPRRALAAAAVVWLAVLGLGVAAWAADIERETAVQLIYTFPPARLLDFIIGMLLGLAFLAITGVRGAGERETWGSGGRSLPWTLAEVACVAALVACVVYRDVMPHEFRLVAWYMPPIAVLILVFGIGHGVVARVLSVGLLTALGRISFAFYIVHFPLMEYAIRFAGFDGSSVEQVAALFAVTLACAWGLNRAVENRARAWIIARGDARMTARRARRAGS